MTAPAMLAVEAALEFLLDRARPITDTHNQHLLHARRCVLAQDIRASVDVPPCDNSAMDGYAVRSSDIQPERMLPVSQRIPAGAVPGPLAEGSVARIFSICSSVKTFFSGWRRGPLLRLATFGFKSASFPPSLNFPIRA